MYFWNLNMHIQAQIRIFGYVKDHSGTNMHNQTLNAHVVPQFAYTSSKSAYPAVTMLLQCQNNHLWVKKRAHGEFFPGWGSLHVNWTRFPTCYVCLLICYRKKTHSATSRCVLFLAIRDPSPLIPPPCP